MSDLKSKKLPDGWQWAKMGDVCDLLNGFAFDSAQFSRSEGTPLIRIRDLKTGQASENYLGTFDSRYLVATGALLIGMDGEFKCYRWDGVSSLLNQRVCRLLPKEDQLDDTFLLYALNDYLKRIEDQTAFTTVKHISSGQILAINFALPPLAEQKRMAAILAEQMATIEKARAATLAQLGLTTTLINSYLRHSISEGLPKEFALSDCLKEVSRGVGADWQKYQLVGATRAGIAPAKESIGKTPERYKLVDPNTIFYNPMRILLGSIAIIDENDQSGITSPDYVVFKTNPGILNTRWFYYWLRSPFGEDFIKSLTRGAVRERLLFRRLASAKIKLPCWEKQCEVAEKLKHILPLKKSLNMQLKSINELPNTMLQRAFNEGI